LNRIIHRQIYREATRSQSFQWPVFISRARNSKREEERLKVESTRLLLSLSFNDDEHDVISSNIAIGHCICSGRTPRHFHWCEFNPSECTHRHWQPLWWKYSVTIVWWCELLLRAIAVSSDCPVVFSFITILHIFLII
jgi:hypothetical protein